MGLLKKQEVKKLIITPDDVSFNEINRLSSSKVKLDEVLNDGVLPNYNIRDTKNENIPILGQNLNEEYVLYSDGIPQKLTRLEDLPKFEVKPGTRVKIPSNKMTIKCPFKCREAPNGKKYFNLLTFTQNVRSESCCGVTYFK